MPLHYAKDGANYKLAVWKIEEEESFFEERLGFISEKKHPKRRLEHLAGRYLLEHLSAGFPFHQIEISATGKPNLPNQDLFFSISHSYPYAAAIISKEKEVGIDIQLFVSKIERLQGKFLSEEEKSFCENKIERITIAWSAKEALFKYYGLGAVDFIKDIPIEAIEWANNEAKISMVMNKTREACELTGRIEDDFALVWL